MNKYLLIIIALTVLTIPLFSSVAKINADKLITITGVVYKKFNESYVQIKDEFDNILKVPRSSLPKSFKVKDGKVITFEIDSTLVERKNKYIYVKKIK